MRAHWRARLTSFPVYSRSIAFVASAPDPATLDRAIVSVLEALCAAGIPGRRLRDAGLVAWIRDGIGPGTVWREQAGHLATPTMRLRGHSLRLLPGSAVSAGWLAPLLAVQADCTIALHLSPAGAPEAVSLLGRRLRRLTAERLHDVERGTLASAWGDAAIDSALELRDRLARNLSRPLRLSLCAVARGANREELETGCHAIRAAFAATLALAEATHFRHLRATLTAAALGRDLLGDHKLVDSAAASTCVPWSSTTIDDRAGYRLGAGRATGATVRVDPFDTRHHANANIAILAASGQGKSFAIGAIVLEALTQGTPSVIIDPEREHRSLVRALGGDYLELASGLLEPPASLDLGATVTGVSFSDLHPEAVGPAALAVSRHLWALVTGRRGRRHIVFDEVGMLVAHPPMRHLLVQLARRCRKYGASLVVATQNAHDLLRTEEGRVVGTNCAVLLLGGHRPGETAVMERAFHLTERQRRFLESAGRGEFLLVAGNRRTEMRVEVPELHRRLLTTHEPSA